MDGWTTNKQGKRPLRAPGNQGALTNTQKTHILYGQDIAIKNVMLLLHLTSHMQEQLEVNHFGIDSHTATMNLFI